MRTHQRLLFFLLLLLVPLSLHAQPRRPSVPPEEVKLAWLNVQLDPMGPAKVSLWVSTKVKNREQLERTLLESFSIPLRLADRTALRTEETTEPFDPWLQDGEEVGWTTIYAENANPFDRMKMNCTIDPRSLGAALQSEEIEHLKIWVNVENPTYDVSISSKGPKNHEDVNFQELYINLREPAYYGMTIKGGFEVADIVKSTIPLFAFLLLPMLLTIVMSRSARKLRERPSELWARHMRFLNRLITVLWPLWLSVYSLSDLPMVVGFAIRPRGAAQFVNILFFFLPPIGAMFLSHLASRGVYRLVTGVQWSPSEVVRRAMLTNSFALAPLFVLVLILNTLHTSLRMAALFAVIGYFAWLFVVQAFGKAFGPKLHALTSGDLRNRIFELAHRAGVALKQIYVLPDEKAQLSNAFARSDDSVMITTSLLKNLSRREVDGIMAHEIGHLQAKHVKALGTASIVTIVVVQVVGMMFATMIGIQNAMPIVMSLSIVSSVVIQSFISRRNERQADAIGVTLTGDPEAFISALAKLSRLNLMPLHSGGWSESIESHPNTMRRFNSVAKTYGIPDERLHTLISESYAAPDSSYPAIHEDEADSVIFSSEFKKKFSLRNALVVLALLLFAPLPFAALLGHERVSTLWAPIVAFVGLFASFGFYQVVRNLIAYWGHDSLSRALRSRLEKRGLSQIAREGMFVGLAPAAHSRKYENYPFWDIGLLWLTDDKLYYLGEQTEFSLSREQVQDVYVEGANPEWLTEKNLFLRWHDGAIRERGTLHFLALGETSILKARAAIDSLQKRLEVWRSQPHGFPVAPVEIGSIDGPVFPEITSVPANKLFKTKVFAVAFQFASYGAVIAFAFGLSWLSIFYMSTVVFLNTIFDELPKALYSPPEIVSETSQRSDYQPGSWAETR